MFRPAIACLALTLPLAACDNGKQGTSFTLNASDDDGNSVVGVDGASGKVSIDTPVFSGALKLPKLQIDAKDFDMNGVHLYPGSTVSGMNIDAHGKSGGDDDGTVKVTFHSPAASDTVRDWFRQKLTGAGFTLAPTGSGLSGKTDDGKPFRLDLSPAGGDKADGAITIG